MKVEIDNRAEGNGNPPFFAVRLYPETNEEMAQMEWGLMMASAECGESLASLTRIAIGDRLHYVMVLEKP